MSGIGLAMVASFLTSKLCFVHLQMSDFAHCSSYRSCGAVVGTPTPWSFQHRRYSIAPLSPLLAGG